MSKSKWAELEQARRDGIGYAYKIALDNGIEGLKKEVEFRNISRVSVSMSRDEYIELREKLGKKISQVVLTLAEITLRENLVSAKADLKSLQTD